MMKELKLDVEGDTTIESGTCDAKDVVVMDQVEGDNVGRQPYKVGRWRLTPLRRARSTWQSKSAHK